MRKELKILPGNLAYSFFLSLIPIVSLIFYFTTTLNLPNDIIQNFLVETFPKGVVELIQPVLSTQMTLDTFIPLCLSIVVATNGCSAIIITSNTIYKCPNSSYIKRMIKSLLIVMIIIFLFESLKSNDIISLYESLIRSDILIHFESSISLQILSINITIHHILHKTTARFITFHTIKSRFIFSRFNYITIYIILNIKAIWIMYELL